MTRFVPVAVLLVVLAAGGVARAQGTGSGSLPGGATLAFYQLKINEGGNGFQLPSSPVAQRKYFNLSHCQCSQMNVGKETQFEYSLTLTQVTGTHRGAQIWTGTGCSDPNNRTTSAQMCRSLTDMGINGDNPSIPDIDSLTQMGGVTLPLSTYDVFAGFNPQKGCAPEETDKLIWILMDTDGDGTLDFSLSQSAGKIPGDTTTPGAGMDTFPPPAPQNLSAQPGGGAIQLSWAAPTARANDINAYQALCARATDGLPVGSKPPSPLYQTTSSLCQIPNDPNLLTASEAMATDANPLPTGLQNVDSAFICGEQDAATATSMRIDGLENGVPYYVMLLAVDLHGNYSGTYITSPITPIPSTDFWQDLHDRGSHTEGGLCLLAETYGNDSALTGALRAFRDDTLGASRAGRWLSRAYYATLARLGAYVHGAIALRVLAAIALAPLVALALLWHWLTLPGLLGLIAAAVMWRRWRRALARRTVRLMRPRTAASAVALSMTALVAGRAHAGGYQPYWEDSDSFGNTEQAAAQAGPGEVAWHVGIRIGPYVPDIDNQLGGTKPGPYEQMFGGYHILPMLDVDRILWSGFGQVGIGLSAGYMQKTARTFTLDSMPSDPARPRASDHNAFRLIPTELSATYRFTWLDDNYGVPVVPYVRGGLGYYIWWVSVADHYARFCSDGSMFPACKDNKALGASLGLQGAIGLAIRAERIDASAAMSMQQSGIQHAGIYAELSLAKIDGFGSDKKLSVGDRTWFAGVDFEF